MLNVAVLVYDLINNYNHTVVDGIYNFFEDKEDVRLIVAPVNVPLIKAGNYDYHFWLSSRILTSRQIDGVIIIPNSFSNYVDFTKLSEELQVFSGKPVISISRKINIPSSRHTFNSSVSAYDQVIEHIKNRHNRKRIAFFTAKLSGSPESEERLESFKKALEKHGLPFYPELVFDGDFTPGTAEEVLSKFIKSREDLNFDAICCVNDFTAGGVIYLFEKIGIKCPEDVVIFGYDDSDYAIKVFPRLSTINQAVPQIGTKAAEIIYRTLKNEKTETVYETEAYPVYRQSCGCISSSSYTTAYYDYTGKYFEKDEVRHGKEMSSIKKHQRALSEIYSMINLIDSKISLETISEVLNPAMKLSRISEMSVCLYPEPRIIRKSCDFVLPEKAVLKLYVNSATETFEAFEFGKGFEFELNSRIVPAEYDRNQNGIYYIHPIFIRDKNYGYIICKGESREYIVTAINLKIISDILGNACEYSKVMHQHQKLMEANENLSLSAKTDELTKLFNRRGFMDYGQRSIDVSVETGRTGAVFFCDLDGLKKINDTWGHKIGDLAIKTEAQVLQKTFRDSDTLGRLSGDEFAVVAPGFKTECIEIIRSRLKDVNSELSKQAGLPFVLSISIGFAMFDSENSNLADLLIIADKELYREKQIKHPERNLQQN